MIFVIRWHNQTNFFTIQKAPSRQNFDKTWVVTNQLTNWATRLNVFPSSLKCEGKGIEEGGRNPSPPASPFIVCLPIIIFVFELVYCVHPCMSGKLVVNTFRHCFAGTAAVILASECSVSSQRKLWQQRPGREINLYKDGERQLKNQERGRGGRVCASFR